MKIDHLKDLTFQIRVHNIKMLDQPKLIRKVFQTQGKNQPYKTASCREDSERYPDQVNYCVHGGDNYHEV